MRGPRQRIPRKCVDCGRDFMAYQKTQIRCKDCQAERMKELHREYDRRRRARGRQHEEKTASKVINGHVQVCRHLGSCFYGQDGERGCSYAIEEGQSRQSQGLYIVDGKCPAYRRKKRGEHLNRTKLAFNSRTDAEKRELYRELTEV